MYDSLSRLTAPTNLESGTITYQYDSSGNILQKVDARRVTTTLSYDDINRITTTSYSDATPAVTSCYNGPAQVAPLRLLML